ncbi:hypothetical protein MWH25_01240 [Natroniella acetigena]|uniref:hypothetical protein n=1 Tax=Natroniella acetigena TaxID=52004 RepID=UPI00200B74A3|nr:hypothetical protein [Natroniella acetigena]MCK8826371.1 hypothetical protein [Natroniella acetigena]
MSKAIPIAKFNFECLSCNELFNVHIGYVVKREKINCPNCQQELPKDVFYNLQKISESFINMSEPITKIANKSQEKEKLKEKSWSIGVETILPEKFKYKI